MASRMAERLSDLGDRTRGRMLETRLDRKDRENDRLRYEVRLLRDGLQEERGALTRALDALKRDEHVTVRTKSPKRRGRILRAIAIGGGAYMLGARAGRERYDQVMGKVRTLSASMQDRAATETSTPWEQRTTKTTEAFVNQEGPI